MFTLLFFLFADSHIDLFSSWLRVTGGRGQRVRGQKKSKWACSEVRGREREQEKSLWKREKRALGVMDDLSSYRNQKPNLLSTPLAKAIVQSCNEAHWANCGVIWHLLTSENVLATTERKRDREGGWCCNDPCLISKWGTCRWPSWAHTPLKWEQKHPDPVSGPSIAFVVFVISCSCIHSGMINGVCVMIFSLKHEVMCCWN